MGNLKNPVSVYNNGDSVYREKYEDEMLEILPGKAVTMSRSDAVRFMGQNPGIDSNTGTWKVKRLEIRATADTVDMSGVSEVKEEEKTVFKCMACGIKYNSQKDLDDHLKTHASQLIKEEPKKKEPVRFISDPNSAR